MPRRTLGIKWVEQEGQEWYKENKAPNYFPIELIHIESLARHYPRIMAKITQFKLEFIFEDQGESNLDWVCEFYANWFPNTLGNEVKV